MRKFSIQLVTVNHLKERRHDYINEKIGINSEPIYLENEVKLEQK